MVGETEVPSRAYVASYFKGQDQQKRAGVLRWRAQLSELGAYAQAGRQPAALDEPTNDLDVETLSLARGGAA